MKEKSFSDYFKLFKRDVIKYVELKLDMYRLDFIKDFSTIISTLITAAVSMLLGIVLLVFLLFALAFFLGDLIGAYHWGFLIVSGIFLLIAITLIIARKIFFTNPIINFLINMLFENKIKKEKKIIKNKNNEN